MSDTDDRAALLRRLRHHLGGAFNELNLCAEILRRERDPERALEWLESIEAAAERCATLAEQIATAT